MAEATARPLIWLDGLAALVRPRRLLRDARVTIPVCVLLICGCFAATALLQMRLDRAHAIAQAESFGRSRAADIAQATGQTLDRYARLGALFAASPQLFRSAEMARAEPGLRDIIVWQGGVQQARLTAQQDAPPPVLAGARALLPDGLAVRDGRRIIQLVFDTKSLAPRGSALSAQPGGAAVPGWPLFASVDVDQDAALESWAGALPLYLFVILGPAAAGAWLAVLLVGAFERHEKAARAVRALRSARPVEARLLVRLANAERGAAEALRAKSEFIAHMSHELRTPLNAVIGFSEVIAEDFYGKAGHPKYSEYARDINEAGKSLHAKIGDILEFANIEAGRFPLKEQPVELTALVGQCVDEHQGRAFSRRITLAVGFGEPGLVRADPQALRRILSNLLANALTYTAEGGLVRADIRFEEGAGVVTLSDSGKGFSAREAAKAGRPFQRFDRAETVTGAGLGLAIAMELARRMGGAMRLAGAPSEGAVMEVRLPRP
ncbi:MAG TPA: ATP-binding protein [Rhizomicrobium sp.]|jgi:signal transduction histidine kinase|nr:ATP-binding protein [Rhizomicrobium sp.]